MDHGCTVFVKRFQVNTLLSGLLSSLLSGAARRAVQPSGFCRSRFVQNRQDSEVGRREGQRSQCWDRQPPASQGQASRWASRLNADHPRRDPRIGDGKLQGAQRIHLSGLNSQGRHSQPAEVPEVRPHLDARKLPQVRIDLAGRPLPNQEPPTVFHHEHDQAPVNRLRPRRA